MIIFDLNLQICFNQFGNRDSKKSHNEKKHMTTSAVLKRESNGIEIEAVENLLLVDSSLECTSSFNKKGEGNLNFFPILVDMSNVESGFSQLRETLEKLDPNETLVLVDAWIDDTVGCVDEVNPSYSNLALEFSAEVTRLGYRVELFLGLNRGHEACNRATEQLLSSYLN